MTRRNQGIAVLAIQLVLVLSIAAKYAWERHTCPRVWTRTAQFDPDHPLRGRYLALSLTANACGLPLDKAYPQKVWQNGGQTGDIRSWQWTVTPIARDGALAAVFAAETQPDEKQSLTLLSGFPCSYASLSPNAEFFISERARTPFPLAHGEQLWAEVTVPPSGPPRPIQLAISDGKNFRILDLR